MVRHSKQSACDASDRSAMEGRIDSTRIYNNNNNNNNDNNNLYFARVTQSNTRFYFRCGPSDLSFMPFILQATELKIVLQDIVS